MFIIARVLLLIIVVGYFHSSNGVVVVMICLTNPTVRTCVLYAGNMIEANKEQLVTPV